VRDTKLALRGWLLAWVWGGFCAGMVFTPGLAVVLAGDPQHEPAQVAPPLSEVEAAETIEKQLDQRIDVDFVNTPLRDVVHGLTEQMGIKFHLTNRPLEEAGMSGEMPVTCSFARIRLRTFLDLLLDELNLSYVEKDGLILITTPEHAESHQIVQVYDCRDLLAMELPANASKLLPGPASRKERNELVSQDCTPPGTADRPLTVRDLRVKQLIDVINATVAPDKWDVVGGHGVYYRVQWVVGCEPDDAPPERSGTAAGDAPASRKARQFPACVAEAGEVTFSRTQAAYGTVTAPGCFTT